MCFSGLLGMFDGLLAGETICDADTVQASDVQLPVSVSIPRLGLSLIHI